MLYTIALIAIILWLLDLATSYAQGEFIHILPAIAIVCVLARLVQERRLT